MFDAKGITQHIIHASGKRKTVCTAAVLAAFGVDASCYHYSSYQHHIPRILRRHGWSVRSRYSSIPRNTTIGKLRIWLKKHGEQGAKYVVGVPRHAMLLDATGQTVIDTDPRKYDRRRVRHFSRVTRMA